ncbi:MAG TPA: protein kinase [Gemmatimonadales bacterium]|nr:protein kinase [Gemmatimonadales bacterium]
MGVLERVREALADRYAIERELGRGGMGIVFLARDLRHNRPVALKILLPEVAAKSGPARFQREIQFAARLQHPHILTVLDSGSAGTDEAGVGQLWFTMPFVEGESLRDRLRRERQLPLDDALRITTETARALDYAHRHGVIHRDIKPENILLTRESATLVTDFGIAHAVGDDDGLTRTGTLIGTPFYMSPEQADVEEVDGRSDLYSLAAVLYEMLAGEPPFTGRSLHAIVSRRLTEPAPSVRTLRADISVGVDQAIRKALALAPADRFATVAEFAQALHDPPTATTPAAAPAAEPAPPRRRVSPAAVTLMAGLLIGGGALFAWRVMEPGGGRGDGGTRIVAVLPFDNLGDSADAYFADGVADEIRTKLAQVAGLEVIARGSSIEYRRAARRPTAIARELGADYLLTGTVRWEKSADGNRVRVTPELVEARSGQVARTRWARQFDASLTDVFQVQADIASRVAAALGVALADSTRRELTAKPTENLAAYDEFLKGEAASQGMKGDQASLRRAIGFYERAVALDSTFVQAWSQLSRARTSLYSNGVPSPDLGEQARSAAERARQLKPNDPSVYLALGDYHGNVNPIDNEHAATDYEQGLQLAPNNVDLLGAVAMTESSLGRWDEASARLARASLLDPRSPSAARRLSAVHTFLRNHAAADSAADHALALAPTSPAMVSLKVIAAVARGDLDSARAVIDRAARRIDPEVLFPFFASYQDLYWVLDDQQQRQVLASPPGAFDDDRGVWGMVRAQLYHDRGDRRRAAIYADSARLAFEAQIRAAPDDGQRRVLLGLALAYLGRKTDAVREGRRGVELMPISRDGYLGPYIQLQLVRIYILGGEPEQALDQLEPLLRVPFYLSPGWLRIDPTFDPLRNNPRFRKLIPAPLGTAGESTD